MKKEIEQKIKYFLIEELGQYLDSLGGKALLGRIWGLLISSSRPMSLKEIAAELKVSKPAISTTISIGVQYGILRKIYNPDYPRENFYEVMDKSFDMMINPGYKKLQYLYDKFCEGTKIFKEMENKEYNEDLKKIKNRVEYIKKCFEIFLEEYEILTKNVISRINELKYE